MERPAGIGFVLRETGDISWMGCSDGDFGGDGDVSLWGWCH
jgi:hypothetical protein